MQQQSEAALAHGRSTGSSADGTRLSVVLAGSLKVDKSTNMITNSQMLPMAFMPEKSWWCGVAASSPCILVYSVETSLTMSRYPKNIVNFTLCFFIRTSPCPFSAVSCAYFSWCFTHTWFPLFHWLLWRNELYISSLLFLNLYRNFLLLHHYKLI